MKRTIDFSKLDPVPRPLGSGDGWVAEHPVLLPELTRVWAPCGCVQTTLDEHSVLTGCQRDDCVFSYEEAEQAVRDLEVAETHIAEVVDETKQDLTVH